MPTTRPSIDGARGHDDAARALPSSSGAQHRRPSRNTTTSQDDEDRIGPYVIGAEIGRGSFATVYKGHRKDNNAPVAIKSVIRSKLTTKLLENLESEISILKRIQHRNIVELIDCLKTDTHIYLIMAFCSAGDLSIYIRKRGDLVALTASNQGLLPDAETSRAPLSESARGRVMYPHPKEGGLNETIVRCFLGQLVDALRFLRAQNVIHRDIKPQNLLLKPADASDLAAGHPPGIPVLKVADFGFARWLPQQSLAETLCGSPLYMAPEILRYEKYDAKADLWSVGAVLFEMSVGRAPFRAQNHVDLLRKIERGEDKIKFPDEKKLEEGSDKQPTKVAADIKALIRRLLKRHPAERMSFEDFFREADAVATGGSAQKLPSAESIAGRHASVLKSFSSAEVNSTSSAASRVPLATPTDQAVRRDITAASAKTLPAAPSVDQEPLPFARRQSSTGSVPQSGSRTPSFKPKYVVVGGEGQEQAAPQPTRRSSSETPSPVPGSTPPSAIARFVNANKAPFESLSESQDSVGKDYVVVEKRTVEINALADELASMPKREGVVARRPSRGFLARPPSSFGNSGNTGGAVSTSPTSLPYPPTAATVAPTSVTVDQSSPPFAITGQQRPSPVHHPYSMSSSPRMVSYLSSSPRSYNHVIERFPGSPLALVGNPSAAIAKALNMASLKIFGSPTDGILVRRSSARKPLSRTAQAADPEEDQLLSKLEDVAQKALVLFDFADSKLVQLLPPTPQSLPTTTLGTPSYFTHMAAREQVISSPFSAVPNSHSPSMRRTSSSSSDRPHMSAGSVKNDVVAAEAVMLYLKALAFLHKGIEQARSHWTSRGSAQAPSGDFNEAVQWFRQRFNECFDKADFAKSRCQDEIPESAVHADKLVYDRALELSRAAAVNELRGENPTDCETAYETALWMLYAILDESVSTTPGDGAFLVEEEDRATITKFVSSITGRLQALRKKLEPASSV
ncbi:Serine/threonine-protein kinase [Microbotryomycetes sp. JL221]|nr:Serine/threonine-protein kinase [Microbotryomycetes sp. JL221]